MLSAWSFSSTPLLRFRCTPIHLRGFSSTLLQAVAAKQQHQVLSPQLNLQATQSAAPSMPSWRITDQHLFVLGIMASTIMGALSCIFLAAMPTLLAIKKAAKSMEILANTTRAELPGTMAAIRLSGMEISDLTMELTDLGQEITSRVRRSTRAVKAAEDGLKRMTKGGEEARKSRRRSDTNGGSESEKNEREHSDDAKDS